MTLVPPPCPPRRARGVAPCLAVAMVAAALSTIVACTSQPEPGDGATAAAPAVKERPPIAAVGRVAAPSLAEAKQWGHARLAFFFVPSGGFAYRDDGGNLTGVTVELLRDFARHAAATHDIALEIAWFEEPLWADFYDYVRDSQGGAFGVGNVTITEARRDELDFSPPYLDNIAVLVTHERVPELGGMPDIATAFAGLTALPYPGTLHEARLDAIRERWITGAPARPVASNDELVALLASDTGYFGYLDVYNYWRARQAGLPLRRHAVGDDASETFGVIMPRDSDWATVMESFFHAGGGYARSDRFRGLLREHLGEELAALLGGG
jgi:ABC-type amino acid transport substrate-binding protein